MTIEIDESEQKLLSNMCASQLEGFYEVLRDAETMSAAMVAYDMDKTVQLLRRVDPQRATEHRNGTKAELEDYCGE